MKKNPVGKIYIYTGKRVGILKSNVNIKDYLRRYPGHRRVNKPPTMATMDKWYADGFCKALDGCKVEIDGTCPHNLPSWMKVFGVV